MIECETTAVFYSLGVAAWYPLDEANCKGSCAGIDYVIFQLRRMLMIPVW